MFRYACILSPFGVSLFAFSLFARTIQGDNLGSGISYLLVAGGCGVATVLWGIGIAMSLARPRQLVTAPGLPGLLAYGGGLMLLAGLVGLALRYGYADFDPNRYLEVNWPFLSWLAVYSGVSTALGGLSTLGRE